MCYSRHTEFFSKNLLASNNPNGENHGKNCPKLKKKKGRF